jgi:hypothetical protein
MKTTRTNSARSTSRTHRLTKAAAITALALGITSGLSGCNNALEGGISGAGLGALAGMGIGSMSGDMGEGAAIGAIGGAILGGILGDQNRRGMD